MEVRHTLIALAVVVLLASPCAAHDDHALHLALGGYMTLNGVDLAQTMYIIGSHRGHESNRFFSPYSNRPAVFGALKIGIDSAAVYGILRIHKDHPTLAWIITSIGIAAETAAAVHNAKLLR